MTEEFFNTLELREINSVAHAVWRSICTREKFASLSKKFFKAIFLHGTINRPCLHSTNKVNIMHWSMTKCHIDHLSPTALKLFQCNFLDFHPALFDLLACWF